MSSLVIPEKAAADLVGRRAKNAFFKHVSPQEDGCWQWTGRIRDGGYGRMKLNGKETRAHRVSWLIHKGDIPNGLCVLHRCDNRLCVNPKHLFLGTRRDNYEDMKKKGRHSHGETHAAAVSAGAQKGDAHWTRRLPHPRKGKGAFSWARAT